MTYDLEEEGMVNAQRYDLARLVEQEGTIEKLALELGIGTIELTNRIYHPDRVEGLPAPSIMARIARKLGYEVPYMASLALRAGYDNLDEFLFA